MPSKPKKSPRRAKPARPSPASKRKTELVERLQRDAAFATDAARQYLGDGAVAKAAAFDSNLPLSGIVRALVEQCNSATKALDEQTNLLATRTEQRDRAAGNYRGEMIKTAEVAEELRRVRELFTVTDGELKKLRELVGRSPPADPAPETSTGH